MSDSYILALDQGTTSSRSVLVDDSGSIVAIAQQEFPQIYPRPGWVEHDANDIWSSQHQTMMDVLAKAHIGPADIVAIGVTNQRETIVIWDRATGEPVHNAIVWQDRRTTKQTDLLKAEATANMIREKTGLLPDPYFSASKVQWLLGHVDGLRERANRGELALGTIDSWIIYKLTDGSAHLTDVSNASRTMLYNIKSAEWDDELLTLFEIPRSMLPEVTCSSGRITEAALKVFGKSTPITGIAGDQQAALFGNLCLTPSMAKNTYGTGCFMLVQTGSEPVTSHNNLLTTIAWQLEGQPVQYALEGSVFVGGAAIQWLRDELRIIQSAPEVNDLAAQVEDSGGVVVVPAFVGLGAPHWDPSARGAILGITRGTSAAHIARATLESIAFQVADVVAAMEQDTGERIVELWADGGASASDLLMQMQANCLGCDVERPSVTETTALGAAYLAGLAVGVWTSPEDLASHRKIDRVFEPTTDDAARQTMRKQWLKAVQRAQNWA